MILSRAGAAPVRNRALVKAGARIVPLPTDDEGRLSLRAFLEWLWDEGVRRALLESGPTLLENFLEAGFVDQMRMYTGNVNGGRGASMAPILRDLRLDQVLHREVGEDAVLEAFPG